MTPVFIIWDIWFTRNGIWGFNSEYILGINIFNLPLEEWLFFICIPFSCIFTYHVVWTLSKDKTSYNMRSFTILLSASLLLLGLLFFEKWYTTITFIGLSVVLLLAQLVVNMKIFYKTFLILIFPFLIVNGLLTGSIIKDEVVWYDNNHNLALRIFTIPVEDIFYAMFMLLMVMIGYQLSLNKKAKFS
tara:strand:+ start:1645 stop:2208 length:564 start_codon:yes stop_codon:yes gene_type:complete